MGEVYRARDGKLNRDVAIKVLPEAVAEDAERLARLQREAQVLASLNHPHIAAIYGLEKSGNLEALVLELVEGETLGERIAAGPIPVDEALAVARQIADALEAAHEKGIVHRDLKPANVKLTPEGKVKVLDFGLAKALTGDGTSPDVTSSPTLTARSTQAGVILGTAAYMSPEQARGKAVDKRADIWAFGALLYEMLTGRRALEGETVSDTLAAVLKTDPDWGALPSETPANVRRVLRRCLERDRDRRLHDIADAWIEIEETAPAEAAAAVPVAAVAARSGRLLLVAAAAALAAGLAIWSVSRLRSRGPEPVYRLAIPAASFNTLSQAAISPDGKWVCWATPGEAMSQSVLMLRALDRFEERPVTGGEAGRFPFFSPDSRAIAFFNDRGLVRVSLDGGASQLVSPGAEGNGTWGRGDVIVFSGGEKGGLQRVDAGGGKPQVLTTPDSSRGERAHEWPAFLPDGRTVLFTIVLQNGFEIGAVDLASGRRHVVLTEASYGRYASTGHLLYWTSPTPTLMAAPFDAAKAEMTGPGVPVLQGLGSTMIWGSACFDVSGNGTLIYRSGGSVAASNAVVMVDRKGAVTSLVESRSSWTQPRFSPDGGRVLVRKAATPNCDLWVFDRERRTLTRQTVENDNHDGLWTPDGRRVTFHSSGVAKPLGLVWKPADGSGPAEPLLNDTRFHPGSWSADGRFLALSLDDPATGPDIWVLSMDGPREAKPFLRTPFRDEYPAFSPDGRYLAYTSNESGRPEVYVQAYPGPGGRWQISSAGGTGALWSRDGSELFYSNGRTMMAVAVTTKPVFSASAPAELFTGNFAWGRVGNYDIAPDGKHFVMVQAAMDEAAPEMRVVVNWFEELTRLVRPGKR
jgi:eukaryotic-like serine/threonine-protein kinase